MQGTIHVWEYQGKWHLKSKSRSNSKTIIPTNCSSTLTNAAAPWKVSAGRGCYCWISKKFFSCPLPVWDDTFGCHTFVTKFICRQPQPWTKRPPLREHKEVKQTGEQMNIETHQTRAERMHRNSAANLFHAEPVNVRNKKKKGRATNRRTASSS